MNNFVSVVILTKNEEKNIVDCLESISWAKEIIVIDDNSEDRTREIAEKRAVVFIRSLNNDFSSQRNFGLSKAREEWVLFLDADERISEELKKEIQTVLGNTKELNKGFYIQRKDVLWGKELQHGETGNIKLLRLAKRSSGRWTGKVHETWDVTGGISNLKSPIIHFPHQSFGDFLSEINFYSTLRAQELYAMKKNANWISIIMYPKAKFILNYFLKLGILDGIPGLIFAVTMSFHSFLVRGKLWHLWHRD